MIMNIMMKAIVLWFLLMAGAFAQNVDDQKVANARDASWEQGTIFVVDTSVDDTIMQLPVLYPHIEDCACTYLDFFHEQFHIAAIVKDSAEKYVRVVPAFDPRSRELFEKAGKDFVSKKQCLNCDFIPDGYARADIEPPYIGFGQRAYLILSPRPVGRLQVKSPSSQKEFKILLVTREERNGKIGVCFIDDRGMGFGLVDLKTGILVPVLQQKSLQFDDFWEEGIWLDDNRIAWCGAGRHMKKWLILDLGARQVLATGGVKDIGHEFCVKDGSLYTKEVGDEVKLIPLWEASADR